MGGESKRRRAAFFLDHPNCCYCGGKTPATTIDHVPPAIFFDGKLRPKGLEMPACADCNRRTSQEEQVAALVARAANFPPRPNLYPETAKIMRAVERNHPGLLQSMMPRARDRRDFIRKYLHVRPSQLGGSHNVQIVKVDHPLIRQSMMTLGRKLACALHYHQIGTPIPADGWIYVGFVSSLEFLDNENLQAINEMLGPARTLMQGSFQVGDQFSVQTAFSREIAGSTYLAKFRMSFALLGVVCCDSSLDVGDLEGFHPFVWSNGPHSPESVEQTVERSLTRNRRAR